MSEDLFERFPEDDRDFLKGIDAKLSEGPGSIYVVLENQSLGVSYTPSVTNLMFQVPVGYPGAAMDMFWTNPKIVIASTGADPIQCSHFEQHMGETWQRWSRHINWRSGVDNVRTFYRAMWSDLAVPR